MGGANEGAHRRTFRRAAVASDAVRAFLCEYVSSAKDVQTSSGRDAANVYPTSPAGGGQKAFDHPDLAVNVIGAQVGMPNAAHFATLFQKRTGLRRRNSVTSARCSLP